VNKHRIATPLKVHGNRRQSGPASNPTFISDCLHISALDFSSFFGNGFITGMPVGRVSTLGETVSPPTYVGANKTLDNSGKDSSKLELNIGYNTIDLTVGQVAILQWK
jgi:hypothetical protein